MRNIFSAFRTRNVSSLVYMDFSLLSFFPFNGSREIDLSMHYLKCVLHVHVERLIGRFQHLSSMVKQIGWTIKVLWLLAAK